MRSKGSYGGVQRRSTPKWGSTLPERRGGLKRTYIQPRSDKRAGQEKEYAKIKPKNKECIFCGVAFKKAEHREKHHLTGRRGEKLVDKKYIYNVHGKCHMQYHNDSIHTWEWKDGFLLRLREVDRTLYEKELNKLEK